MQSERRFPKKRKLKKFLRKNEIYFTTISSVLLGAMAIILAFYANRLASRQLDMDYFEKLPDFQVSKFHVFDENLKKYSNLELHIKKLSGKAKNIEISNLSYLEVEYNNLLNPPKISRYLLEGFYNSSIASGNMDGLIQTERGIQNALREYELEVAVEDSIVHAPEYVKAELKTFVKIKYLNFENNTSVEYFDVSSTVGKLVTDCSVKLMFEKTDQIFDNKHVIYFNEPKLSEKLQTIISTIK